MVAEVALGVGVALLLEVGPSVEVGMVLPSHWLFGGRDGLEM